MIWLLAILAGLFGRLGGAGKTGVWYDPLLDTKWRDWGVSSILTLVIALKFSWSWWLVLIWITSMGALTTYYDILFGGKDELGFSGLMMGFALLPGVFIGIHLNLILIRAILLFAIWGLLNRYTPKSLLAWRGDIVNEFLRYFSVIATLAIF